jgi:hypothetical protein
MTEKFVVLHAYDDRSFEYIKNVLGHGGCNTFPERVVNCECGVITATNALNLNCPRCGKTVIASESKSFSTWSTEHPGGSSFGGRTSKGCEFISSAARNFKS